MVNKNLKCGLVKSTVLAKSIEYVRLDLKHLQKYFGNKYTNLPFCSFSVQDLR